MDEILIVYFTWSGNSQYIANLLKEELKADIFQIQTVKKYSNSYVVAAAQAGKERVAKEKVELLSKVENIFKYNKIILIYPIWWFTCPLAVFSFLEDIDTTDKIIYPISNHNGSGLGKSIEDIKRYCLKAIVKDGFSVKKSDVKKPEIFSTILEYVKS